MNKTYRYTVTGRGAFPFDMLRYDQAWPRTGGAVETLQFDRRDERFYRERRSIDLLSISKPTVGRWNSFGWLVENVETI